jgi:hypothetical protein
MARCFEFRVIRYEPDVRRGERVNIGLLVLDEGRANVHLYKSMQKALALAPSMRLSASIRSELEEMFTDVFLTTNGLDSFKQYGFFSLSDPGRLYCETHQLQAQIDLAMKRLVAPERRRSLREGKTRLYTTIKNQFKRDGVLASDPSQIREYKVVAGYEFPGDDELFADFAFKNGAWHLTQVLDYRVTNPKSALKKIKEVSLKAIALDQAAKDSGRLLGEDGKVVKNAVVWVPDELQELVAPQIDILADYAELFRFNNNREKVRYLDMMSDLTKSNQIHH